ncbi:hypothetical protein niasHT_008680 [Heterodera trifolii]|uniref:Regulatory protein zeste n=1 Tax=Heterodera trifolii TaxID=157864 RepID=A0ABD2M7G4_9BILA
MVFSSEMNARLSSKDQLFPCSRLADAGRMQKEAWSAVTQILNSEFSLYVPAVGLKVQQVQTRWKNIRQTGKEDAQKDKKHRLGTGDGMEFSIPNSSKQVIQMFGTSASFSGVPGGAETSTTRGDIVLMESEMTGDESSFGGHGFGDEEKEITELTKMPMSSETSFVPIKKFRYESPAGRGTPISRGSSRPPSSRPSTSEIAELQLKVLQCDLERIELQKQLCEEAKKFMEEGRKFFAKGKKFYDQKK